MQSRSIDQMISGDRSTASQQVRPASLKGRRTPKRRAGRSRAGRSRKPLKRPDGSASTTARRGLRLTPRPKDVLALDDMIAALAELDANGLCLQWRNHLGGTPPAHLPRWLLMKILAYRLQAAAFGGLDKETLRVLRQPKGHRLASSDLHPFEARIATTREGPG
jgi:Protein of unknown function (DUF2924)